MGIKLPCLTALVAVACAGLTLSLVRQDAPAGRASSFPTPTPPAPPVADSPERDGPGHPAPSGFGFRKAFVQPNTGRLIPDPLMAPESPDPPAPMLAPDWLREIPGATAAGGVKLNLRGRFRHTLRMDDHNPNAGAPHCTPLAPATAAPGPSPH